MLWIAITSPSFHEGEEYFLKRLLAHGVDLVHLRKPEASEQECAGLLESLSETERSRIVVHDFFGLALPYGLHGIHLNSRHNTVPDGYTGHVSRSCHSLEEVTKYKDSCGYVFLSPIFDSISKHGYVSAFSRETLRKAAAEGIIDEKVVALGGVTPENAGWLEKLGFGGAAMLGCVNSLALLPQSEQDSRLEEMRRMVKGM